MKLEWDGTKSMKASYRSDKLLFIFEVHHEGAFEWMLYVAIFEHGRTSAAETFSKSFANMRDAKAYAKKIVEDMK